MGLQKIKAPQITDSIISEIVTKIVETFHPEKIILFGSYVWGKPKEWNDIDILVVMDYTEPSSRVAAKISLVAKPQYSPMDILARTPDEIAERIKIGDYFFKSILTKGRVLYERRVS
jgi:predicted nucleotidyltransferase